MSVSNRLDNYGAIARDNVETSGEPEQIGRREYYMKGAGFRRYLERGKDRATANKTIIQSYSLRSALAVTDDQIDDRSFASVDLSV